MGYNIFEQAWSRAGTPKSALLANHVKGNIKLNIVDAPGFGPTKEDTVEDLAIVTGAKVINESLGDDIELLDHTCLGEAVKSVTNQKNTPTNPGLQVFL